MKEFFPNYDKCLDERKQVYWGVCKHLKKDVIMICSLNNRECIAWKGYKHVD
jgi:hypothetical protein